MRLILEKVPFLLIALRGAFSLLSFRKSRSCSRNAHIGIAHRVANALVSYAMYSWNTFWPHDLALFYPYPRALSSGAVMVSVTFLILVSVLCFAKRRSSPYLIVGWFWYLGMLVPVIGLIQVGEQARADRYTYLPQIGSCLLVTWGAMELFAQVASRPRSLSDHGLGHQSQDSQHSVIAKPPTGGIVKHCGITLWPSRLTITLPITISATTLMKKGRLDEAMVHFRKALEIYADYPEANNNLGYALGQQGQMDRCNRSYRSAIRLRPNYPKAHNNLGVSLAETGKTDEALAQFNEALRVDENYQEAHYNLAALLVQLADATSGGPFTRSITSQPGRLMR